MLGTVRQANADYLIVVDYQVCDPASKSDVAAEFSIVVGYAEDDSVRPTQWNAAISRTAQFR